MHARNGLEQQTQRTLGTCAEESESSTSSSNTQQQQQQQQQRRRGQRGAIARNCGTAAVVSKAAAIRQEEHTHSHWLGEVIMTTGSRFFNLRNIRSRHQQQQQQRRRRRRRRGGAGGGVGSFGDDVVVNIAVWVQNLKVSTKSITRIWMKIY